jgi:hypothetical protein
VVLLRFREKEGRVIPVFFAALVATLLRESGFFFFAKGFARTSALDIK